MIQRLPSSIVRQLFSILLILGVAGMIIFEMLPYLSGVLGAITLYVLLERFQVTLERKGWKPELAAITLLILSIFVILIPISLIVLMLSSKVAKAIRNSEKVVSVANSYLKELESYTGTNVVDSIDTSQITNWISTTLQSFLGSTFNVFIVVGVLYFLLYYMLVEREDWKRAALEYLPLKKNNAKKIGKDSKGLVASNAVGIPLVALMQGVVALIGFFIFGVDNPFFWFVVTAVGSMIPFIGTAIGILPVTLLLLSQGNTWQAVGLLIYGLVVVGATDNLFRLVIQRKMADLHPLITLFGVLVGVPLFGFIGLIFGPLLISLLLLLVKIYKQEYADA